MILSSFFSWRRFSAVLRKEFIQMRRDRLTFVMMVGVPLLQLILFGYAINMNPRHLSTAVVLADHSLYTRTFLEGLKNTQYFNVTEVASSEKEAERLLAEGKVSFVVSIPPDFSWRLVRGLRPQALIEADATDPVATGSALSTVSVLVQSVFNSVFTGNLTHLKTKLPALDLVIHAKYNPEQITSYNIVPGLLGVVLSMTMVMITSLAITRERERGTMESLLATPVRPAEVMLGKIVPYIIVGYIQVSLILLCAVFLFHVPILGSLWLLLLLVLPFIIANLSLGLTFSSLAKNQLQAVQMSFFFFLPSILLSGFMFPFDGMPRWAQSIGQVLPLTHFLRITRGILLKGNDWSLVWPHVWPILLFMVVVLAIGIRRYQQTLD